MLVLLTSEFYSSPERRKEKSSYICHFCLSQCGGVALDMRSLVGEYHSRTLGVHIAVCLNQTKVCFSVKGFEVNAAVVLRENRALKSKKYLPSCAVIEAMPLLSQRSVFCCLFFVVVINHAFAFHTSKCGREIL